MSGLETFSVGKTEKHVNSATRETHLEFIFQLFHRFPQRLASHSTEDKPVGKLQDTSSTTLGGLKLTNTHFISQPHPASGWGRLGTQPLRYVKTWLGQSIFTAQTAGSPQGHF